MCICLCTYTCTILGMYKYTHAVCNTWNATVLSVDVNYNTVYTYIHTYICVCIYIYICIIVYIYICMYYIESNSHTSESRINFCQGTQISPNCGVPSNKAQGQSVKSLTSKAGDSGSIWLVHDFIDPHYSTYVYIYIYVHCYI